MKAVKYLLVALLVVGLMAVRYYQTQLFYDPFLHFFEGDFMNSEYPDYDLGKLTWHILFRYFLNTVLSVGIIYFLFQKIKYVRFSVIVFAVLLVLLLPIYLYFIESQFSMGFTAGFYIRRFLIQPLILLIFIPAFYYLEYKK